MNVSCFLVLLFKATSPFVEHALQRSLHSLLHTHKHTHVMRGS